MPPMCFYRIRDVQLYETKQIKLGWLGESDLKFARERKHQNNRIIDNDANS